MKLKMMKNCIIIIPSLFLLMSMMQEMVAASNGSSSYLRKLGGPQQSSDTSCSTNLPSKQTYTDVKTLSREGLPDREYRIYTPANYDNNKPTKLILALHGWSLSGKEVFHGSRTGLADEYNYILVAPRGLGQTSSWTVPGSSDGLGVDGHSVTTCNVNTVPNDTCAQYHNCECKNPCGWTQCEDDDFQFVVDLLYDLNNYVCVDKSLIFVYGESNGGMLTWSMGQDERTADMFKAMAAIISRPHHDHNIKKATKNNLPVIGIYGNQDLTIGPGNYTQDYFVSDQGYRYVAANRMHNTWARDHGCNVVNENEIAPYEYIPNRNNNNIKCHTHCSTDTDITADDNGINDNVSSAVPYSVDCRADMGHVSPDFTFDIAIDYFEKIIKGQE